MEKNEVFKIAMLDYHEELELITKTSFAVIEKIIRGINISNFSETDKRIKLQNMFSKINGSNERKIMGVNRNELSQIIDTIFKVKDGKISNFHLKSFNMDEILYYFCYISRMAVTKTKYSLEEIKEINQEVLEIVKRQEEKVRAEEEAIKEKARKAEEERKIKEEAERKAEKERLANMSELEKKLEKIKNDDREENYVELYNSLDQFDKDDRLMAAKILKKHWLKEDKKWEGKLSRKQKIKVGKVKAILDEK